MADRVKRLASNIKTYRLVKKENDAMEKTKPYLKEAFMEVVDNQITSNDPPETRETLDRLTSQGISED